MMPAYDLSNPSDRLQWAIDQPNKSRRQAVLKAVRRKYGEEAAQQLLAGLHEEAKRRAA